MSAGLLSRLFGRPSKRPSVPRSCSFANAKSDEAEFTLWFSNQLKEPHGSGGWVLLSPYGRWPNNDGLQIVDRESANAIVEDFHRNVIRKTLGLPWYIGHPDHPAFSDRFKDTAATGRVKELKADDEGLWANVTWNSRGRRIIEEQEYDGHSVNWRMRRVPGGGGWQPVSLKSVGWTNEPQIPVPAIETANIKKEGNPMIEWLKEQLVKLGVLKAEATDDDFKAQANALLADATRYREIVNAIKLEKKEDREAFANAHKDDPIMVQVIKVETECVDLRAKLQAAETLAANETKAKTETAEKLATAEKALADSREANKAAGEALVKANETFANERKAHAGNLVKAGLKDSRITPATQKDWEKKFEADFANAAKELDAAKPTLHTTSMVNTRERRAQVYASNAERSGEIQRLVNLKMREGFSYESAHVSVEREHPELYAAKAV